MEIHVPKKVQGFYLQYKLSTPQLDTSSLWKEYPWTLNLTSFKSLHQNTQIVWNIWVQRPVILDAQLSVRRNADYFDFYFDECAKLKSHIFYHATLGDKHQKEILGSTSRFVHATFNYILQEVTFDALKTFKCNNGQPYIHLYMIDHFISVDHLLKASSEEAFEESFAKMDQINLLDCHDKITNFGTRCSIILDQFSLRNEPYELRSQIFYLGIESTAEYKFIVRIFKDFDTYKFQMDFLADYNKEGLKDYTFFYMICDRTGKQLDNSDASNDIVRSFNGASDVRVFDLMSDELFKNWTFVRETPLVLVFYVLYRSPAPGKPSALVDDGIPHCPSECQLSADLANLYEKKELFDFNVVTKSKTFGAHKCVLAARSAVFAKYFEDHMNQDTITINLSSDVVEEMLRYMYTNSVKKLDVLAVDLYNIAIQYDMQGLKKQCVSYMGKNVSVDNAMILIHFAKKHNENTLLSKVTRFFMDNTDQVLDSKMTDSFLQPLLHLELILSPSEPSDELSNIVSAFNSDDS